MDILIQSRSTYVMWVFTFDKNCRSFIKRSVIPFYVWVSYL